MCAASDFVALSIAAGVAASATRAARAADLPVVENNVTVKTPDGSCDAALFHPAGQGTHAAVLIWPDIFANGLRPQHIAQQRPWELQDLHIFHGGDAGVSGGALQHGDLAHHQRAAQKLLA